jgi:hypothetical protein
LGELILAIEHENDANLNKSMKIIVGSFPKRLINIAKCYNEDLNNDSENLKFINITPKGSTSINIVTVKELQITLKHALKRVEKQDFNRKLEIQNFDTSDIIRIRKDCKNSKLRNIYFRLIHNNFFTHARMYKYKMTPTDKCPRCNDIENTKHLLWECAQVKQIWNLFNNLMQSLKINGNTVVNYEDIYKATDSTAINIIKVKLIQELVQIHRPRNWQMSNLKKIILDLTNTEKYNAIKSHSLINYYKKWAFLS